MNLKLSSRKGSNVATIHRVGRPSFQITYVSTNQVKISRKLVSIPCLCSIFRGEAVSGRENARKYVEICKNAASLLKVLECWLFEKTVDWPYE